MSERVSLNGCDWLFKEYVGEEWIWRNAYKPDTRDRAGWRRGHVPGSVQYDLWQAGEVPDPYWGRNSLLLEWVPARTWVYKRTFAVDPVHRGRRALLSFSGVDYSARFYLNGELLGAHRGMFTPATFEVGDRLSVDGENLLAVVLDPAPDEQPQVGYTSRVRTHKSRMNYWWDFCPRMVHVGIWDDVTLEMTGPVHIEDVFVQPHLVKDLRRADVSVDIELSAVELAAVKVETALLFNGRRLAVEATRHVLSAGRAHLNVCLPLAEPELWWPNGHGSQPLYEAEVTVTVEPDSHRRSGQVPDNHPTRRSTHQQSGGREISDVRRTQFGIRRVEVVANETSDPTARPYTLVVNGRKLYIKGWNWVPIDVLYGVERPEKLARLIGLAKRANVNLLRVWGGGLIEKESFYDLCDRNGIMVWQEFIQSSSGIDNVPPDDPAYTAMMREEARQIVPKRRNHPALVIWCGGNELMDAEGRPIDETRAPVLAALREVVRELDPGRYWLPTSPSGRVFGNTIENIAQDALGLHDVHGPWEYQGLTEQHTLYNAGTSLLHSEFGVEGLAHLETIQRCMAAEAQWPVTSANPAWSHTAAWWLKEDAIQAAFGKLPDTTTMVAASQFLQAEGLRYAVEADRRRKYHNSGTLPWQLNEPYPNAACTSAVDYYGQPKPAYYAVARAYAAVQVSARFPTQAWDGQHHFTAEIWACNSHQAAMRAVSLTMRLVGFHGTVYASEQQRVVVAGNAAVRLATVDWALSGVREPLFFLDLRLVDSQGSPLAANRYCMSRTSDLRPMLTVPGTIVTADLAPTEVTPTEQVYQVTLTNAGDHATIGTWLADERPADCPGYVYMNDNYLSLLPGETRVVGVTWDVEPGSAKTLVVSSWNTPRQVLEVESR